MKNLLLTLISFFILVGCAQKPVVISTEPSVEKDISGVQKEQIPFEEFDIKESENIIRDFENKK